MKPSIEDIIEYIVLREKEIRIDMDVQRFPPKERESIAIKKNARILELRRLKRHINQNTLLDRNRRAFDRILREDREGRLSKEAIAKIERAREEMKRGEYYTLDEVKKRLKV